MNIIYSLLFQKWWSDGKLIWQCTGLCIVVGINLFQPFSWLWWKQYFLFFIILKFVPWNHPVLSAKSFKVFFYQENNEGFGWFKLMPYSQSTNYISHIPNIATCDLLMLQENYSYIVHKMDSRIFYITITIYKGNQHRIWDGHAVTKSGRWV